MTFQAIVLLALGLAMDATAVAAARGLAAPRLRARDVALVAALFGGFQALMPLIGWLVGTTVGPLVERWQHWVVFVLLGGIGARMLWEAREAADETDTRGDHDVFDLRVLLLLAVATSIDALAAGGMRFDNAYLTTSSCSPSRSSIITANRRTASPATHRTRWKAAGGRTAGEDGVDTKEAGIVEPRMGTGCTGRT